MHLLSSHTHTINRIEVYQHAHSSWLELSELNVAIHKDFEKIFTASYMPNRINAYSNSFSPKTIRLWNSLPEHIVTFLDFSLFKQQATGLDFNSKIS